jgi:serine/threonine protein kinase/tetratricopeptide (TPR) repeat protein
VDVVLMGLRGVRIGPYEVVKEIGRGGMGRVFAARTPQGGEVALKLVELNPADTDLIARFELEATALRRLRHDHVVGVGDLGRWERGYYLAMELVRGESLAERLRQGPLEAKAAAELLIPLCRAVAEAHRQQILHRDLKPENVLLREDGHPLLTDFGLARRLDVSQHLTATGEILGTPSFMAPEQAQGERPTPAVDVYGLGGILYATLCGQPPFTGSTVISILSGVLEFPPRPPSAVYEGGVDAAIERICLRCLEKDPQARYASADALAEALHEYLHETPPGTRPLGRGLAAVVGLLAVAGVGVALLARAATPTPADPTPATSGSPLSQSSPPSQPSPTELRRVVERLPYPCDALAFPALPPREAAACEKGLRAIEARDLRVLVSSLEPVLDSAAPAARLGGVLLLLSGLAGDERASVEGWLSDWERALVASDALVRGAKSPRERVLAHYLRALTRTIHLNDACVTAARKGTTRRLSRLGILDLAEVARLDPAGKWASLGRRVEARVHFTLGLAKEKRLHDREELVAGTRTAVREWIALHPRDVRARLAQGEMAYMHRDGPALNEALRALASLEGDLDASGRASLHQLRAFQANSARNIERASREFHLALEAGGDSSSRARSFVGVAEWLTKSADASAGLKLLDRFEREMKGTRGLAALIQSVTRHRIETLAKAKRYKEAARVARAAIPHVPTWRRGFFTFYLAQLLLRTGDKDASRKAAWEAVMWNTPGKVGRQSLTFLLQAEGLSELRGLILEGPGLAIASNDFHQVIAATDRLLETEWIVAVATGVDARTTALYDAWRAGSLSQGVLAEQLKVLEPHARRVLTGTRHALQAHGHLCLGELIFMDLARREPQERKPERLAEALQHLEKSIDLEQGPVRRVAFSFLVDTCALGWKAARARGDEVAAQRWLARASEQGRRIRAAAPLLPDGWIAEAKVLIQAGQDRKALPLLEVARGRVLPTWKEAGQVERLIYPVLRRLGRKSEARGALLKALWFAPNEALPALRQELEALSREE